MIRRTTVTRHMRVLPHTPTGRVAERVAVDETQPFFILDPEPAKRSAWCVLGLHKWHLTGRTFPHAELHAVQWGCDCGVTRWEVV